MRAIALGRCVQALGRGKQVIGQGTGAGGARLGRAVRRDVQPAHQYLLAGKGQHLVFIVRPGRQALASLQLAVLELVIGQPPPVRRVLVIAG